MREQDWTEKYRKNKTKNDFMWKEEIVTIFNLLDYVNITAILTVD